MIQLELFSAVYQTLTDAGLSVFDGSLPPAGTPYPFTYLADCEKQEGSYKAGRGGQIYQTVHIWQADTNKRGDLLRMMETVLQRCARITKAGKYGLTMVRHSSRIVYDDTTKTPLLHGVLDLTYEYS